MTPVVHRNIVLDDGEYYVDLAAGQALDSAVGFLERRCRPTGAAPNGFECLGAFTMASNLTWEARIATAFDISTGRDCKAVAAGVSRLDAIAALWRARRDACFGHSSL